MPLKVSLATWDHDRVAALHDGRVGVDGLEIESHILPTTKLFPIAVQEARFDITELSVSSYALQVSRGDSAYTAIPAFVSRAFRHGGFFGRAGSGVESPGRTGALDEGVRKERLELALPPGMVVEPIVEGETLQDLLLAGEIDGLLAPKPPAAFLDGDPRIVRLLLDYEAAERDYFQRTGFFPIMHLIAVRKSLVADNPWLPRALLDAFTEARDIALARLRDVWLGSANRLSLPWLGPMMERTLATMGPDYWPYGFAANRAELAAVCRYSRAQHLAARDVTPEEMFHPSVLES
jgi:4,5-dihydroxyphthalate decarboxylase